MGRPNRKSPPRLGVSACLLGHEVRFDGGHKRDRVITDLLGDFVVWVPICPEVEVGMGVPRPALRLVRDGDEVRMLEIESGRDHTRRMNRFALRRVRALRQLDLSGYVLKKGSPSCGKAGVQILDAEGRTRCEGRGLFDVYQSMVQNVLAILDALIADDSLNGAVDIAPQGVVRFGLVNDVAGNAFHRTELRFEVLEHVN